MTKSDTDCAVLSDFARRRISFTGPPESASQATFDRGKSLMLSALVIVSVCPTIAIIPSSSNVLL